MFVGWLVRSLVPSLFRNVRGIYVKVFVKVSLVVYISAEAIRTTVVPISGVIRTTVVPISGVIGPTVVRIANATGIGYRHDGSIRFSYKLTNALNY